MKKIWIRCIWLAVMSAWAVSLSAGHYAGKVVDESGVPMPFVSVYVKDNPYVGTVTGYEGEFTLNVPDDEGEGLIFSFVGFRTVEVPLAELRGDSTRVVTLAEQPVLLDGTEILAKLSKNKNKKVKKAVLSRFVERLEEDFPPRKSEYRVVSSYHGTQDDRQLGKHEIIGLITEYPVPRTKGGDSITVLAESVKEFTTDELEMGYDKLNELFAEQQAQSAKKNKRKKDGGAVTAYKAPDLDLQMMKMHRYLWGGYTGSIVDMIDPDKVSKWDYTMMGGQNVLVFTEKRNYIGIVKMKLQMLFYVDPATLSVEKITQSFEGELNIPFGYKLKDEELELVNILQMDADTLYKYRVKHVNVDVKRNVFFREVDGHRVVNEKNLDVKGVLADRKDQQLNYSAQAKAVVIGKPKVEL